MSGNPTAIPTVNDSWRNTTPSVSATTGFTYVMIVARSGPISAISAKNNTNPTAVHTTPSTATDSKTDVPGTNLGRCTTANGR
jgi:hypothetical protein